MSSARHPTAGPEPQSDSGSVAPETTTRVVSGGDAPASPEPGHEGPGPHGLGTAHSHEVSADEEYVPSGDPEAPTGPAGHHRATAADAVPGDGTQVALDLQELTARAAKADEYLQLAQRTQADFENYRKRAAREAAAAQDRGVAKLAKELLPAVDNLDRALEAAEAQSSPEADPHDGDSLVSGIKLVHADVVAALARLGIERFSPEGEPFDPQRHEAVAHHPVEGAAPGTVVEVYQRGYRLGESMLRPARVVVAQ